MKTHSNGVRFFCNLTDAITKEFVFLLFLLLMESVNLNISLSVEQLIQAVQQLSPKDKLKLNDAIWNEPFQIPEEHKAIVLDRIAKSKANPGRLLDWDEVSKNL